MITPADLRLLLVRPISFHRAFADMAGSAAGGLFLSQLFYWCDKGDDPDGWIYKTQADWTQETCLTRSEQERARKALRDRGILEEIKRGTPARLFYRLDVDALARMLNSASLDVSSRKQLSRMLDPASKDDRSCDHSPITETTSETTQRLPDPSKHDQIAQNRIWLQRLIGINEGNRIFDHLGGFMGDPATVLAGLQAAIYDAKRSGPR